MSKTIGRKVVCFKCQQKIGTVISKYQDRPYLWVAECVKCNITWVLGIEEEGMSREDLIKEIEKED